jgi:hypothetical protein
MVLWPIFLLAGGEAGCPFATSDSAESRQQWHRADYHAKAQAKPMADKVML